MTRTRSAHRRGRGRRRTGGARRLALLLLACVALLAASAAPAAQPGPPDAAAPAVEAPGSSDAPPAAVAAAERARQALAAGDAAGALADFEAALRQAPDHLTLGSEYRHAAIAAEAYDRAIAFFTELTAAHPRSAAARLNLGYAHVDKIPAAGSITQVLLANTALGHFTAALEIEETWLGLYTRGNSYVYWPPIFQKTKLGIADLERAVALAERLPKRPIHARAWVALGDGHWRLGDLETARAIWRRGLERHPGTAALAARLERQGEALESFLDETYALGRRVDTDLSPLGEAR